MAAAQKGLVFGIGLAFGCAVGYLAHDELSPAEPVSQPSARSVPQPLRQWTDAITAEPQNMAVSGMVDSATAASSPTFLKVSSACFVLNRRQYLSVSLETDPNKIAERYNKIAQWDHAVEKMKALPISATAEEEAAALSFLDDAERGPALKESDETKAILHDAAATIFGEYDAMRFYLADNRSEASTLFEAAKILRKHAFPDIVARAPGTSALAVNLDNQENIRTLMTFADRLVKETNEDSKPEDVAAIFRAHLQDSSPFPSGPRPVETKFSPMTDYQAKSLLQHTGQNVEGMSSALRTLYNGTVDDLEKANDAPYRIQYWTAASCGQQEPKPD